LYRGIIEPGGARNADPLIQGLLSGVFAGDAVPGIVSASDGAVGAPD
jgi:hypothetical protein